MLEAHLERRHLMFRTIVVAVDGSKYSEEAVELAKRLAAATDDEIVVAHVTALLLGSVAHKVLHLSQRPVLIAR
jgi:nucleotide-binding universal stress UspA family protein